MFAVLRVKGNNIEVLGKYDDLNTAKAEAKRIHSETEVRVTISVIEADFDENDRIKDGKYKLYNSYF